MEMEQGQDAQPLSFQELDSERTVVIDFRMYAVPGGLQVSVFASLPVENRRQHIMPAGPPHGPADWRIFMKPVYFADDAVGNMLELHGRVGWACPNSTSAHRERIKSSMIPKSGRWCLGKYKWPSTLGLKKTMTVGGRHLPYPPGTGWIKE